MSTFVHFIDVDQGNMVLIQASSGENFLFDCNVTDENENRVFNFLSQHLKQNSEIKAFICSHRDADHIRGIEKIHAKYPILSIWDSDYPGTSIDSSEYKTYMALRRRIGSRVIQKKTEENFGETTFRYLSARDERLPDDANSQGIVMKVDHTLGTTGLSNGSTMLTGDSDGRTWHNAILKDYDSSELKSDILMAGHQGSKTFLECKSGLASTFINYTRHIETIRPDMCVISVGANRYGHPDEIALRLYKQYCRGAHTGQKIVRTDLHGSITVELGRASVLPAGWCLTTYRVGLLSEPLKLREKWP